jgi:hypothetical protein
MPNKATATQLSTWHSGHPNTSATVRRNSTAQWKEMADSGKLECGWKFTSKKIRCHSKKLGVVRIPEFNLAFSLHFYRKYP